jgi:predicted Zn-dependent protease with MMP-like domain
MAETPLSALSAPAISDIEQLAAEAFAALPADFRVMCGDIIIGVDDFPADDVLKDMDAEPFDLLGLFQGVGLAHDQAVAETGRMPNMVFLYRRAILDYWAENDETLGAIVTHVLVHEIGHHFGLSDADMEDIERRGLERIEREQEKLLAGAPPVADDDDAIEKLGKRIARILGPLIAIGLCVYLATTYLT